MRRAIRGTHWIGRSLAAVAVLSGIVGAAGGVAAASTAHAAIHKGGTVTVALDGFGASIDPAFAGAANFTGVYDFEAMFGPGLFYVDPNTGAVENGFVKKMTSASQGRVWMMSLYPKLKFSDGTAFNAASVCDLFTRDANPATGSVFASVAQTVTCVAKSATTAKMSLTSSNYYWPAVISQDFAFVPSPTAIATEGSTFGNSPVGAGPFKMQSNISGISHTYVKNPYYALFAPGQPYLDSVVTESTGTLSQIVAALQSGQAQMSDPVNVQYATEERAAGMRVTMHSTAGGAFLALNTAAPPFNNLEARQAVYDVINRQGVANVWTPGNPGTSNLFPSTSPYFNKSLNWPVGDVSKAQTIFNQLAAAGTPVKFSILWPAATAPQTPAYIQSLFAGMQNVTVTVNLEPSVQYIQDAHASNFQMTAEGLYNSSLIPAIQQWFQAGGSYDFMKWDDAKANAALSGLYSARTMAQQKTDWNTIIKEMITQIPVIWTQQGRIGVAYNPNTVAGIHAIEFGNATLWGGVHLLS